ncbi:CrcB-like protein-domain-containing protein [Stachybotrys elegans]|uniref:CrcB-like protein-domain-containing protein n=1 Tax=Stachybotrys elegans TaxID=80388 RepID=A0A8K0SFS9_9HYPO|nr:CrcB-like protein-domain-containing protein [Stachybotrys elegans]
MMEASSHVGAGPAPSSRDNRNGSPEYEAPERWKNITDATVPSPKNRGDGAIDPGTQGQAVAVSHNNAAPTPAKADTKGHDRVSKSITHLYTVSYLIFFSFLGTLARVGLAALTSYPGSPVIFSTIWANVGGSLIMGFLTEERKLFRHSVAEIGGKPQRGRDEENAAQVDSAQVDTAALKKAHLATKKTIPLYIGLATGFCGCFTSFSSFIRDVMLALSNSLETPDVSPILRRNGGYSFMAMLAVIITTVALSLSALVVGSHLAKAVERVTPSIPAIALRKFADPIAVVLGWGCWVGAIIMSIFPPHESWRGIVLLSLVFAPLGCLARFYLALRLNGKSSSFPVGTFVANVLGTVVLGMSWDIAHAPIGGIVGCQVLQGVEDGFCGCLTTISTWVAELRSLRRRNAYMYGTVSVVVSLLLMIAIMGGLRWSDGFSTLLCKH